MAESNQSHAQDAQYASSGDADAVTADAWGCTLKTRQYITELQAVLEREIGMRESAQRTLQLKKQQWEESFNDLRTHFERSSATQRDSLNLLIERERELKQRLNACNEQLAAVLSSTSWKLTAPLRVVARIFPAELRSKISNIFRSRS
ncbi:hypothetical protein [Variovorax sp. DXTD-1]|uniref:hypothetical protein n=1 Tax=Variovorax sp. DXTD-1 TaxID=2495592 RepID=UPI000F85DEC1|nr:hypothetical protein [Variovorax sp. DXTD-1]RST49143.1 hypothetical protein EJI00_15885 [Variovorax sp. DXTD-1]